MSAVRLLKSPSRRQIQTIQTSCAAWEKIILEDTHTADDYLRRVEKIPTIQGMDLLRNPKFNKGVGFSLTERQVLGIHGLLPPAVNSQSLQIERTITQLRKLDTDLAKYIFLNAVSVRNERLFYQVLMKYTEELLPIVYTPTVGKACQEFGLNFRSPNGLFVTIHDHGHVYDIIKNWPERRVGAVVMTDGERILGLGDLGCNGMGIPIGKLALYTACGGIHPSACLPMMIDVGTNNETLLNDPMYIGLRDYRHTGPKYDALIDEVIYSLRKRYGPNTLIQFEDFAGHNAARLLEKTRDKICSFNDDIQGTASVVLAGLLGAQRHTGQPLKDQKFLFLGAGAAGCGIGHLIVRQLVKKYGMTKQEAAKKVYMVDVGGLLTKKRPFGEISPQQALFCHDVAPIDSFEEAVKVLKPTAIIGVSGVGGAFNQQVCESMAQNNNKPIIFALSNPTSHSECTAEDAYKWTDGRCLFASGSPFDPVTMADGRTFHPAQGNNVYIFPGLALGVIASKASSIPEDMFLEAAETVSEQLTEEDMKQGRVYPPLKNIRHISFRIGVAVAEMAYKCDLATIEEPESKEQLVQSIIYNPDYLSNIPKTFKYPDYHAELN